MIEILITGVTTGNSALVYERPGRQGRRKFVPTYVAFIIYRRNYVGTFSVTRHSSANIFGEETTDIYGENGECPPSREGTPYLGLVREDGPKGFRIQLYENGCPAKETLVGVSNVRRKNIQIHFGAAASFGCIMVAGSRRDYTRNFARHMRELLKDTDQVKVFVFPRES